MITDLFKVINSNKGCIVSLNVFSIVNDKALSNFNTYSHLENALFTGIEGHYEMNNNLPGYYHYEGVSENGLLINFKERQQLFIPEASKVEMHKREGNISFDIKDNYSSMHINLQVFIGVKNTN